MLDNLVLRNVFGLKVDLEVDDTLYSVLMLVLELASLNLAVPPMKWVEIGSRGRLRPATRHWQADSRIDLLSLLRKEDLIRAIVLGYSCTPDGRLLHWWKMRDLNAQNYRCADHSQKLHAIMFRSDDALDAGSFVVFRKHESLHLVAHPQTLYARQD